MLVGCAIQPTPEELYSCRSKIGDYVGHDEAESIVKDWFRYRLKDPYSADYNIGQPQEGYMKDAIIFGGRLHCGYVVDVSVNAKNSYGGYTGFQNYKFIISQKRIEVVYKQDLQYGTFLPVY